MTLREQLADLIRSWDVEIEGPLRDDTARERAVALVRDAETTMLNLLVLPRPPWSANLELTVRRLEVGDPAGQAVVSLE